MLPSWMHDFSSPGIYMVAFGLLCALLALVNGAQRNQSMFTGMVLATAVSVAAGIYTVSVQDEVASLLMLRATAIAAALMFFFTAGAFLDGLPFQGTFLFAGTICLSACSVYEYQTRHTPNHLALAVSVLELLAGMVLVFGPVICAVIMARTTARQNIEAGHQYQLDLMRAQHELDMMTGRRDALAAEAQRLRDEAARHRTRRPFAN